MLCCRRLGLMLFVCFLPLGTLAAEPDDGWRDLFNGRDLSGWQVVGTPSDCWGVVDGCIEPTSAGGWLSTDREYGDFELELEYNIAPGGNSGVFLRAPHGGRTSRLGMEIQLLDDFTKDYGKLQPWQLTGSLYAVAAAEQGAVKPAGEWQHLRIRAAGRQLQVVLNGQQVLDVDLARFPEHEEEHPGLKRRSGYVGLQNYGGRKISFRNIRLRELAESEPTRADDD